MARHEFQEIGPFLDDIIRAIRARPLDEVFKAEDLLPQDKWHDLEDGARRALGWQLRELLRVLSAVKHVGRPGEGRYCVASEIPARAPFDGGAGRS